MFENDMEDEPSNPSKSSDSESASMNSAAEVEVEKNMENEWVFLNKKMTIIVDNLFAHFVPVAIFAVILRWRIFRCRDF